MPVVGKAVSNGFSEDGNRQPNALSGERYAMSHYFGFEAITQDLSTSLSFPSINTVVPLKDFRDFIEVEKCIAWQIPIRTGVDSFMYYSYFFILGTLKDDLVNAPGSVKYANSGGWTIRKYD